MAREAASKKAQKDAEASEVAAMNKSLRDSLAGKMVVKQNSIGGLGMSKSRSIDKSKQSTSINKSLSSVSPLPPAVAKNVDTTKEFVDTVNYNLNSSNTGF